MSKNKKIQINVKGDFINSTNQSGGTTAKNVINQEQSSKEKETKKWWEKQWFAVFAIITGIATLLGFAGLQFHWLDRNNRSTIDSLSVVKKAKPEPILRVKFKQDSVINAQKRINKKKNMFDKEKQNHITINGDVVTSNGQTGGVTAHTVIYQNGIPLPSPRHLNSDDINRLNALDKSKLIIVTICMLEGEANQYGVEIVNYLQGNGFKIQVNGYQQLFGGGLNKRFDINTPDDDKIDVTVPVQK
ncbi:hypothetical protein [Mucilaginibacter sp. 3215]|uniref:hypothetical protein n=1 Tax=Mucilaginibacter sp. 3215 TaxID=3373912 RepID=UPI003D19A304